MGLPSPSTSEHLTFPLSQASPLQNPGGRKKSYTSRASPNGRRQLDGAPPCGQGAQSQAQAGDNRLQWLKGIAGVAFVCVMQKWYWSGLLVIQREELLPKGSEKEHEA